MPKRRLTAAASPPAEPKDGSSPMTRSRTAAVMQRADQPVGADTPTKGAAARNYGSRSCSPPPETISFHDYVPLDSFASLSTHDTRVDDDKTPSPRRTRQRLNKDYPKTSFPKHYIGESFSSFRSSQTEIEASSEHSGSPHSTRSDDTVMASPENSQTGDNPGGSPIEDKRLSPSYVFKFNRATHIAEKRLFDTTKELCLAEKHLQAQIKNKTLLHKNKNVSEKTKAWAQGLVEEATARLDLAQQLHKRWSKYHQDINAKIDGYIRAREEAYHISESLGKQIEAMALEDLEDVEDPDFDPDR